MRYSVIPARWRPTIKVPAPDKTASIMQGRRPITSSPTPHPSPYHSRTRVAEPDDRAPKRQNSRMPQAIESPKHTHIATATRKGALLYLPARLCPLKGRWLAHKQPGWTTREADTSGSTRKDQVRTLLCSPCTDWRLGHTPEIQRCVTLDIRWRH